MTYLPRFMAAWLPLLLSGLDTKLQSMTDWTTMAHLFQHYPFLAKSWAASMLSCLVRVLEQTAPAACLNSADLRGCMECLVWIEYHLNFKALQAAASTPAITSNTANSNASTFQISSILCTSLQQDLDLLLTCVDEEDDAEIAAPASNETLLQWTNIAGSPALPASQALLVSRITHTLHAVQAYLAVPRDVPTFLCLPALLRPLYRLQALSSASLSASTTHYPEFLRLMGHARALKQTVHGVMVQAMRVLPTSAWMGHVPGVVAACMHALEESGTQGSSASYRMSAYQLLAGCLNAFGVGGPITSHVPGLVTRHLLCDISTLWGAASATVHGRADTSAAPTTNATSLTSHNSARGRKRKSHVVDDTALLPNGTGSGAHALQGVLVLAALQTLYTLLASLPTLPGTLLSQAGEVVVRAVFQLCTLSTTRGVKGPLPHIPGLLCATLRVLRTLLTSPGCPRALVQSGVRVLSGMLHHPAPEVRDQARVGAREAWNMLHPRLVPLVQVDVVRQGGTKGGEVGGEVVKALNGMLAEGNMVPREVLFSPLAPVAEVEHVPVIAIADDLEVPVHDSVMETKGAEPVVLAPSPVPAPASTPIPVAVTPLDTPAPTTAVPVSTTTELVTAVPQTQPPAIPPTSAAVDEDDDDDMPMIDIASDSDDE
jgi:hypothetical protein